MFSIEIVESPCENSSNQVKGEICIGSFREMFMSELGFWDSKDYVYQWKDAIKYLLNIRNHHSCLITSVSDPTNSNFLFWWLLYKEKDVVYIQNAILFLDQIKGKFELEKIYDYIPERETVSEEGDEISEWQCSVKDFEMFLK